MICPRSHASESEFDNLKRMVDFMYKLGRMGNATISDETLRGLMEHANSFADQMENFEHIYSLSYSPAIETSGDEEQK